MCEVSPVTCHVARVNNYINKTKVIKADLLDLDFDFEDSVRFCKNLVMVTFQFW